MANKPTFEDAYNAREEFERGIKDVLNKYMNITSVNYVYDKMKLGIEIKYDYIANEYNILGIEMTFQVKERK